VTGATITPRAVVKAVNKALIYFAANRDNLFEVSVNTSQKVKSEKAKEKQK